MLTITQLAEKIVLPAEIDLALKSGCDLVVSVSGGKDSDAMTRLLHHMRFQQQRGWTGRMILLHAHLGRAEHRITLPYLNRFAAQVGLPLHVLEGRDLVDVMKARKARLDIQGREVPFWPSARARYCTSDLKRAPISAFLRTWAGKRGKVICAMGMRAAESTTRAKKAVYQQRKGVHTQSRTAYDWLPLHQFTTEEVWNAIGYSGDELKVIQKQSQGLTPEQIFATTFKAHPAYVLGNERLSCGLCILGSRGDLKNGAYQHPEVYREYVQLEIDSGFAFQPQRWLGEVAPELLPPDMQSAIQQVRQKKADMIPKEKPAISHHHFQQLSLF